MSTAVETLKNTIRGSQNVIVSIQEDLAEAELRVSELKEAVQRNQETIASCTAALKILEDEL